MVKKTRGHFRFFYLVAATTLAAASLAYSVMIPGGGKGAAKNDCYSEFNVTGATAKGKSGAVCTDCDPTCDKDGSATANNSCTFEIEVCAHQADAALPKCTSPQITSFTKLKPPTLSTPATPADAAACGDANDVPAAVKKKGKKPGAIVKLVAVAAGKPPKDPDALKLFCLPRVGACPTTTTTTTTTSTTLPADGTFDFTTATGVGNCGVYKDGSNGTIGTLGCGGLDIGGGNVTTPVPEGPTPDGATYRLHITGQASANVFTLGAEPTAGSDFDCTNTGCHFGPPLPIVNGGTSTCVVNTHSVPASGTVDVSTGDASLNVTLSSKILLVGDIQDSMSHPQVCPVCSSGTCTTGTNHGMACTSTNSTGLSRDCPPGAAADEGTCTNGTNGGKFCHISTQGTDCPGGDGVCGPPVDLGAPLAVDLTPLKTGMVIKTSDGAGQFCTDQSNNHHQGCFNHTNCRSIEEDGIPAGALTETVAKNATLASVFCVPKTNNILVDNVAAGLPGPGATTLSGTMKYDLLP
jgi:hypothetical protein